MTEVSAIMVNWNGGALAVECAASVARQTAAPTLWVVDNGSRDGSADAILRACPNARLVRNVSNLGFAAANNQALRRALAESDYVLLVNNDALLPDPESLARVVQRMKEDPRLDGACGRYEYPDGSFQRFYNRLPDAFDMIVNWGAGRHVGPLLRSSRTRRFHMQDQDFSREADIEQPAFSCVLLRAERAREVGLLDEQFPIFFNDVDYCRRWREKGFRWRYLPEWRVVHFKSSSTSRMGGLLKAEFAASAVRFARKHFSAPVASVVVGALVAEALWRKLRHGDLNASASDIRRGRLFFCAPGAPAQSARRSPADVVSTQST